MARGDSALPLQKEKTRSKFHLVVRRASAGLGLFAGEPIPKGARIIEYTGIMLTEAEYQKSRSSYLFEVGPRGALDGAPRWNTARYINHSCAPNCEPDVIRRRVYIEARRRIEAGEELTYNYGPDYFDENIGKHCRCVKCRPELHPERARKRKRRS